MLIVSISSTDAQPTAHAAAVDLISRASRSRSFDVELLGIVDVGDATAAGRKITAPAQTGPASGLMPASSTPATWTIDVVHSACSNASILRRRWPSARCA